MNYHIVSVRSRFIDTSIRSIHAHFFHGKAKRGGFFPTANDYRITHEPDKPLRLHKNVYNIGNVFAPEFELVVSNLVAKRLARIPNLELLPVQFELLYGYPYEIGDLGCGFKTSDAQERFIDGRKDDPALHSNIGTFYQLEMLPVRSIREQYRDTAPTTVELDSESYQIPISSDIFTSHPAYSLGGSTIMSNAVYECLEPYVDWTYFTHCSGPINGTE